MALPLPLAPLTPIDRRRFDYTDLDHGMAQMDQAIRKARRALNGLAGPVIQDRTADQPVDSDLAYSGCADMAATSCALCTRAISTIGRGGPATYLLNPAGRSDRPMTRNSSHRALQAPAKPVGQRASKPGKTAPVPAVARRGRLTLQQIKRAVGTALRGQTFEADAPG